MTMANSSWAARSMTLVMHLEPADPVEELTCMFCWGPKVEWVTTLRLGGRTLTVGIHECCRSRLEAKPSP